MNFTTISNTVSRVGGRSLLVVQKHAPEILTTVGVLGMVASGVLASRATLKLEPIIARMEDESSSAKDNRENLAGYSNLDYKKDTTAAYTRGVKDMVILYGPSVTLAAGSALCIVGAHGIMRRRNVALVAAYKVMEQGWSEYRKRVVEEFGEEKDREFKSGIKTVQVTDDATGKQTVAHTFDPNAISRYAKFFDEGNVNWQKDPELNLFFLTSQQNYLNDLLRIRGHVTLNDVYDRIGIDRTKEGFVVGWVFDKSKNSIGDNFIDFGIYTAGNDDARRFVNGDERSILLDFNVDGLIYDLI